MVAPTTLLLETNAPPWARRFRDDIEKTFVSRFPQRPVRLWSVPQAGLPPAEDWPFGVVWVSDLGKLGVSNGVAWVDAVGGPL